MSVVVRAPAKVNLALLVGPPRTDGFHPLNTVYQAISLYDDVRVSDADEWSVTVSPVGPVDCSGVPLDESNIVIRAGRLLAAHHGLDRAARVEIRKGIPVAGGLAGGSADGAAALIALDRLWDAGTPDEDLLALAAELGSDVPFALLGGTAHGTGRGEIVEPVPDAGTHWWVVVPDDEGMSTPAVYRHFDEMVPDAHEVRDPERLLRALSLGYAIGDHLRNDLEGPAIDLRPELRARMLLVMERLDGTVQLTGSGPTIVGLASSQGAAQLARGALIDAGLPVVHVATGPVAGAHVVEYD